METTSIPQDQRASHQNSALSKNPITSQREPPSSGMTAGLWRSSGDLISTFVDSIAAEADGYLAQGEQKAQGADPRGEINCQDKYGIATTPATWSGSIHTAPSLEDSLALIVGRSAYEYLEECFYTEVSVLDREKFDAVPEIVKSDFAILGHLGRGNFSDVFEVACKGAQLLDRRCSSRGRGALSSSVTTATLARPSTRGKPRPVFALKCLCPQIRSNADQFTIGAEDLVHETAILANLNHRHIIKLQGRASGHLTDAFLLNDGYFILLDKLEETLCDRIDGWKRDPKYALQGPAEEQLEVVYPIADAMCYLHSKNIIFRDLKPANVGFDSMGVMKLFDFGFAAGLPEKERNNPCGYLYDRCGTPRYMAPEVGLSLGYGLPADVYSFGIVLWEVCGLTKPFSSIHTPDEFNRSVFVGGKRPPVEGHWPASVRAIMSSC